MLENEWIEIAGARVHNLKDISLEIPRDRLVVVTGLSGSGKSSLAFDTICAEGQRRYMDTLSAYARQFIGMLERPDIDEIKGLSPVISIEQKTVGRNPRSTVGTITEIYDFFRLLYARAAQAFSPESGKEMVRYSDDEIIDLIIKRYEGCKILLLAPLIQGRKGHYRELFAQLQRRGYNQVRIDGQLCALAETTELDRYRTHFIELVVDKLVPHSEDRRRIKDSVADALSRGKGSLAVLQVDDDILHHFSRNLVCPDTGLSFEVPAPHTFSFNSPHGACPHCRGLGKVSGSGMEMSAFPENISGIAGDDDGGDGFKLNRREASTDEVICPTCKGTRLKAEALNFRIDGKNIAELSEMSIGALYDWVCSLPGRLSPRQLRISEDILKELRSRIGFLKNVGLDYLPMSRATRTLSGGESQRIRLATQIGSRLVNVLYVLDEPSIGLHQRDNRKLIDSLRALRDEGNSVMVVEHDEEMMRSADWLVDLGPGAGDKGGHLLYNGSPRDMDKVAEGVSSTIDYLLGRKKIALPGHRRQGNGKHIVLKGAKGNNLKNVTLRLPLGLLIGVSGVSGSGKSSLINETLMPAISNIIYRSKYSVLPYDSLEGVSNIDKIIEIDQSPIGRSPRSNPATYVDVMTDIRRIFEQTPDARIRGFKANRFSFNVKGGRCETCRGAGLQLVEMHFLPPAQVTCRECGGRRYKPDTLAVKYKGKDICEVLDMTISQAAGFFEPFPSIAQKLRTMEEVGLGYLTLGQPATTLSGGESQRLKLSAELARKDTGNTLYLLDEPTTGLHFEDIKVLIGVLQRLVDKGNTVVVIEHNLDVLKSVDWLMDLGPDGGENGGTIIAEGTPEDVARTAASFTGKYLKRLLESVRK